MNDRFGIEIKEGKITLVESRLARTIADKGMKNLSQYLEAVLKDKTGVLEQEIAEKLTTNHTYFMREPEHFSYFQETILPYLSDMVKDRDIRTWSAGCSSGEEAYTMAMLMSDYFGYDGCNWNTKILATDISTGVLKKACAGCYPKESIQDLPEKWKKTYFTKLDEHNVQISEKIQGEVIFRHLNLSEPQFPFKRKFHVIFCRNVMIYFDAQMKAQLIKKFYNCTEPGGYLFIGHSESLGKETFGYKYVKPTIYRKEPV